MLMNWIISLKLKNLKDHIDIWIIWEIPQSNHARTTKVMISYDHLESSIVGNLIKLKVVTAKLGSFIFL